MEVDTTVVDATRGAVTVDCLVSVGFCEVVGGVVAGVVGVVGVFGVVVVVGVVGVGVVVGVVGVGVGVVVGVVGVGVVAGVVTAVPPVAMLVPCLLNIPSILSCIFGK